MNGYRLKLAHDNRLRREAEKAFSDRELNDRFDRALFRVQTHVALLRVALLVVAAIGAWGWLR